MLSVVSVAWWAPAVVLIAGNVLARVILPIMKAKPQVVAMVGVIFGLLLSVLVVWV